MEIAGSKIKGAFGGVTEEQKEMASMLGGVGTADGAGGGAEANGGTSSPIEKAKEELLGGGVTGGGGGGLGETNEILKDILDALKGDKETAREEERESDRQHKETIDAMEAGGTVVGGAAGLAGEGGGGNTGQAIGQTKGFAARIR